MTTTERRVRLKDTMLADRAKNKAAPGVVIPLVKDHLMSKHGPDTERRWDIIHPSEMAKNNWCHVATYNRIVSGLPPEPEKFDFIQQNIFGEGNMIHAKWQKWLTETGKLWGEWYCTFCAAGATGLIPPLGVGDCLWDGGHHWDYAEISLGNSESHLIMGHADGAVERTLIEFKSVGLGTIRLDAPKLLEKYQTGRTTDLQGLWRAIERPLQSHLRQGDIYLWLAKVMGYDFDEMSYVYEFKPTQQVKEFPVKFSQRRVQPLLDRAEEIEYALQSGKPPVCTVEDCKQCTGTPIVRKKRRVVKG